jgi:hypothetical protein
VEFCKQGKNPADVIAITLYEALEEAKKILYKERKEFRINERKRSEMVFYYKIFTYM